MDWRRYFWGANYAVSGSTGASVEEIYSLRLKEDLFIKSDVIATYRKILTDVIERTHGIDDKYQKDLWDNYVVSEAPEGLISLLVQAMYDKADLYVYYNPSVNVLRKATPEEQKKIDEDYKQRGGKSSIGAKFSFRNFDLTDLLKVFSLLDYCILRGLYKGVNLTRAIQIKMNEMRKTVGLQDSSIAIEQAKAIAAALGRGDDVLLDAEDSIESSTFDISPVEKAMDFTNQRRAYYLGLPMSYISGLQTGGIGSTGEADTKAIERGLKTFYYSIIGPALTAVFGIETTFVSSDFRFMEMALEVAKTFDLLSDDSISQQSKNDIIAAMFDLDPKEEQKRRDKEAAARGSSATLNGAQVQAMSGFLAQLATGQLAPDTAISALMVSFNLPREDAEAIVEPMQNFQPKQITAPANGGQS